MAIRSRLGHLLFSLILVNLPLKAVVGTVVEDHSGSVVASAEVRVIRGGTSELIADLETDSNGRFETPDLPIGDYRIEISKSNYLPTTLQLNGASKSFAARLIRCGVISGRVLDAQGNPVQSARVFAMTRSSDGAPFRPFAAYEQGHQTSVNENASTGCLICHRANIT